MLQKETFPAFQSLFAKPSSACLSSRLPLLLWLDQGLVLLHSEGSFRTDTFRNKMVSNLIRIYLMNVVPLVNEKSRKSNRAYQLFTGFGHFLPLGKQIGDTVLFFGCRKKSEDYIYEDELASYSNDGTLSKLHVAFSRDQVRAVG